MSHTVVDVHAHIGLSATLEVGGSTENVLRIMDANGIDQSIISPIPGFEDPDGIKDTERQNDNLAAALKRWPDRFPRGMGVVEPRHGKKGLPEVDRVLGSLGLSGIMFHNDYNGVYTDHPAMIAIIERAAKYPNIVINIHTAQHSVLETPFRLGKLADLFPNLTFLDAHPMMDVVALSSAIDLAKRHPNIVFDTCLCHHHLWPIEQAVKEIGADRLLFGSDNPYFTFCMDKLIIEKAEIPDAARRKIFSENAKRVFRYT